MQLEENVYGNHKEGLFPFHHGIYGYEEVITICLTPIKYVKLYQENIEKYNLNIHAPTGRIVFECYERNTIHSKRQGKQSLRQLELTWRNNTLISGQN